ncbi:hypothetical protein [Streptomyces sp. NPDC088246]|uniref:hypothetical protein n=1 Tax=Streptomyces sp. NPDC088246 TaxID=3365842 RepID=UPI0037F4B8B3
MQARYALNAPRTTAPAATRLSSVDDLTTLNAILADVREVRSARTLGPLMDRHSAWQQVLLETLEVFPAHNGS